MNVDGYEQQCEDVHNMYDDGFVYNMDDFPPLASLSGKSKINFEKKLAGKRMIITGAIKKGGEEGHAGLITTKAAPQGPAIHAHKVRSEDADNHVLKKYVQNVYGKEMKPKSCKFIALKRGIGEPGSIEIGGGTANTDINTSTDSHTESNTNTNTNTTNNTKKKGNRKRFWEGISSFTASPSCETIKPDQISVCEWFHDEDPGVDEEGFEDEEGDEEAVGEVKAQMMQEPRGSKRASKRRGGKEERINDWTKEGDPMRKKAFKLVEGGGKAGEAKLTEVAPSKQIWGLAKLYHEETESPGQETKAVLFDPGNLSQSLMGLKTLRRFERQIGRKLKLQPYLRCVKGAGGAQIDLLGQTCATLSIELPGLSRRIKFRPIICSSDMAHINVALNALKEHGTSLHMMKNVTWLEDVHTKEKVSLYGRDDLMQMGANVNTIEVVNMVNQLRKARPEDLDAGDVIDLNTLERKLKSNLKDTEVLVEDKQKGFEVVGSMKEAWDVGDEIKVEENKKYPGNLKMDIRKAKSMTSGQKIQPLRVNKDQVVEKDTHGYIPCKAQVQFGKDYLINPCSNTVLEAGGLLVTPSLGTMKNPQSMVFVSAINVTSQDIKLRRGEIVGYLELFDEERDEVVGATEEMFNAEGKGDKDEEVGAVDAGERRKDMYHKEWPPEKEINEKMSRNPQEYDKSGFILLDKNGRVEKYLSDNDARTNKDQGGTKAEEKGAFWRPRGARVSDCDLEEAKRQMWKEFNSPPPDIDPKYGQKTRSKRYKLNEKLELKKAEEKVKAGDKGLFAHGRIYPGVTELNKEAIRKQEAEEEEAENKKRYLKDISQDELLGFIRKEIGLEENEYLRDYPILKEMVTQLFLQNYAALTPAIDDDNFRYDPGFCSEIVYHPELKPQYQNKIFSAPIKKLSPDDDAELGRILRSWVRSGILRKQDMNNPQTRSEHSHRLVLVRKKPDGGPEGGRPKPKRITLDLRDLNSCSYTHKHHLASVQDHLSSLEKGGIYCSWDLDNYFSSIPCSEYGSRLLSFSTFSHGSFSYRRLAQGWSSAPGVSGALGARLCGVLDPGTLHLYCDDGLQVGRERWVDGEKLETLKKLGNIDSLISENPATPEGGKSTGKIFHKSQSGKIWSETSWRGPKYSWKKGGSKLGTDVPSGNGLGRSGYNPNNPKEDQVLSPEDRSGLEIPNEVHSWVYVSANVDLLIKMHDFLQAVIRFNLRVSPRKIRAYKTSLPYLGYQLGPDGIKMQSGYLDTILKYKLPRTKAQTKSFCGLIQYFSSITPHLARYTAPLYEAMKRSDTDGKWALTEFEAFSFHQCKVLFLRSDGVGYIEMSALEERPLRLWCDWSTVSVGSFLSQIQRRKDGQWGEVLLACTGKKNSKVLSESGSCLGEMYALALGLAKYRPYLLLNLFEIFSDFLSLNYLHTFSKLRGVHYRLFQNMSDYVFRIFTVKSAQNYIADLISRSDNVQITKEEMDLLGLHEAGTQVFTDDSDSFKTHWKVFKEDGPGDDSQLESESQEPISQIQKVRTQEIRDQTQTLKSEIKNDQTREIQIQTTTNPSTHSSEARRAAKRFFWDDKTRQQKPSQYKLGHNDRGSFCRSNGQGPFTSQPAWNSWAKNGGTKSRESQVSPHQDSAGCLDSRFGILNGGRDGTKTENRSHLRHTLKIDLGGRSPPQKVREGSATLLSNFEGCPTNFQGDSTNFQGDTKSSSYEGGITEQNTSHSEGGSPSNFKGGSTTQNLSFEGGKCTLGSKPNFSKDNFDSQYSQYEGIWDKGVVIPSVEMPIYTMIENNKSLSIGNLNQMNYMPLPSYTCSKKSLTGQCNHLQLKFPYLDRDEDVISSISCLPTQDRSLVKQVFDHDSEVFNPIYREGLIKAQNEDRLITKVKYFVRIGWPTVVDIKQMFPSRGLMEYFFNRKDLKISPDGLLIRTREKYEYCLEERSCIPFSLVYHVFKYSHYGLDNFHASIDQTYQALSYRYFIPELAKFLRFYISRCAECLQSRLAKPKWVKKMTELRPQIAGKIGAFNQCIFTDLSGRLPESHPQKYKYFLVIACKFSGYIETCPLRSMEASEIASAFIQVWFARFGQPTQCISDVGSNYTAETFQRVFRQLGIIQKYTNTSIPRAEWGEVCIRQLKLKLKGAFCGLKDHSKWPEALAYAALSINNSVSPTHLFAPSELALGSAACLPISILSSPGPNWGREVEGSETGAPSKLKKQNIATQGDHVAKEERGRINFPMTDPIMAAHSQDLDILRLRKSDPIRLMYGKKVTEEYEDNLFTRYILVAALSELVIENKIIAFARSIPLHAKAKNPLFPLKAGDEGRMMFRYNPIRRSEKKTAGSLYGSWEGPLMLTFICNEVSGILEGYRNGRAVAYRTPIDHMRVFYDLKLAEIPGVNAQATKGQGEGEDKDEGDDQCRDEDGGSRNDEDSDDDPEQDGELELSSGEEEVNEVWVDLKRVAPKGRGDLPNIKDVKSTQVYNTVPPDRFLERILNLPDSELVLIEPRMELLLRQENPEDLILQLEELKDSNEDLIFHRMLPMETKTRHQGNLLDRELEVEKGLMLASPIQRSGSGRPVRGHQVPVVEAWAGGKEGEDSGREASVEDQGREDPEDLGDPVEINISDSRDESRDDSVEDQDGAVDNEQEAVGGEETNVEREAVEEENDEGGGGGIDENDENDEHDEKGTGDDDEEDEKGAGGGGEIYPNWVRTSPLPKVSPFLKRRISSRFLAGGGGEAGDNQDQGGRLKGPLKKLASYLPEGSYWPVGHGKRTRSGKK